MGLISNRIKQTTGQSTSDLMSQKAITDAIGGLNGTNYIMVYGVGTPAENAIELQAAYDAAKTMPRYLGIMADPDAPNFNVGQTYYDSVAQVFYLINRDFSVTEISEAQAKSVRTTVIVAPGNYNFALKYLDTFLDGDPFDGLKGQTWAYNLNDVLTYYILNEDYSGDSSNAIAHSTYITADKAIKFVVDTERIDVVSLTGNCDLLSNGISVDANNVYLKGFNSSEMIVCPESSPETIFENCKGSFYSPNNLVSTFKFCEGDWSYDGTNAGKYLFCRVSSGVFQIPETGGVLAYCMDANGSPLATA